MIATTNLCDVYHLTIVGSTDIYNDTPDITGLDMGIFPAGTNILAIYPGQPSFALYELFTEEVCTLVNGDKIVSDSDTWIVRGDAQIFDNDYGYYIHCVGEKQL